MEKKRNFCFYRSFCPETSQKMEIPIVYMDPVQRDSLRRALPSKVLLRHSSKRIWSIGITRTGNDLFFQNGWEKFVDDNCIRDGDNLFFEYDGSGLFDFLLFDKAQREKVVVSYSKPRVMKGSNVKEEDGDGYKKEKEVELTHSKGKKHSTCGSKRGVGAGAGEGSSSKKTRPGRYTLPTNPYFVATIRERKCSALYIPRDVLKKIALPPTLILRDPRGQEWRVKTKVQGNGQTVLLGGWRSLCCWNLLQKGDRCICEFVPREGNDMVLQVTIIQGVSKKMAE